MAPKSVEPMSWGWSARPGTDHGPLCTSGTVMTEHTVDWRCARSVLASDCAPGDRGRHHALGRARVDDEVRAAGPPAEADRHAERHVARGRGHRQRHRRPALALRERRRRRARRARVGRRVRSSGAPSGPGSTRAPGRRSRCAPRRSGTGRRSRAGRPAHPCRPSGAAWPPSAAAAPGRPRRATTGRPRRAGPSRCTRRRRTRSAGPAAARWSRWASPASMVDCPAPESRTKGNGPWPPMQTFDRLGDLAGDDADRERHLLAAAGLGASPRCSRWRPAAGRR